MMWRRLYGLLWYAVLPLAFAYLWRRGIKQPDYRLHWRERLGFYPQRPAGPLIWLHAVSVGETRAALPIVRALQERYPQHRILLTQMTPTGRDTARSLYGDTVLLAYLPYDVPAAAARFLRHFQPEFGVLMEMEIWPNLLHAAKRRGLPVYLVNARLSARSADGYRKVAALVRPALASLAGVAAQGTADAARLQSLGAAAPLICGNIKFDFAIDTELQALGRHWRKQIGDRPVWIAASTREGEEVLLLDALAGASLPENALLILVPRHPQRFDEVARLLAMRDIPYLRRSHWSGETPVPAQTAVLLGDSMGEMAAYLAAADVAVMGGSLLDYGCQSPIEPCAQGLPVLVGPSTFNFSDAVADAVAGGAARQSDDVQGVLADLRHLLNDAATRHSMGQAGMAFVQQHRGALARVMALLP
ncbi:lipid IV(A) 3-deoxy-D-manno-octulosonic acid transferase [Chitinimonas sp.]|uniref:lipid IV(A) 3-deoxy-D-manno-octulosonic acid transferase n=1 Tax=Chitinimonas sp. TaxID=1934313 RepID=UPI0035AEB631